MAVISRTPVRISFGGGGTDFASHCERKKQKAVSDAMKQFGFKQLDFKFDFKGATVLGEWGENENIY